MWVHVSEFAAVAVLDEHVSNEAAQCDVFVLALAGAEQFGHQIAAPLLAQARLKVARLKARHSEQ